MRTFITLAAALVVGSALVTPALQAQYLDPAEILHPKADTWPTYSGDYSGRRFSPLTEINTENVHAMTLMWASKVTGGIGGGGGGFGGFGGPAGPKTTVGGIGSQVAPMGRIVGTMISKDGIMFVTTPDNAWALDVRDGHELWHYLWKTRGGTHIGNRGVALWHDRVYFETPDDFLLCLDAKTGTEIWHKEIASFDLQYFSTMAPVVIGNHLLVGTGNDLDEPGLLQSFNPESGEVEWKWYATPQKAGDPGLDTWKDLDAAQHGGGNVWVVGSYDPDTHLYIFGTANPTAAYTSQTRGPGANLYTCALVAVNVETGKLAWYYQTSPHDTHDFDSAQTPVLVDGTFNGKPRKMVLQGARNGYFFVIDRLTGEHLLTSKLVDSPNWASPQLAKNGEPTRIPAKDYDLGGALVSPANGGIVNWPPPAYSPQTELFYVHAQESYAMYYLSTTDPRGAMGLGGKDEISVGSLGAYLLAIDYKTGKSTWKIRYPGLGTAQGLPGLLTTAGHLLFAADARGNFIAHDAATGKALWHSHISPSSAAETFDVDGHQYVFVAAGDTVYAYGLE